MKNIEDNVDSHLQVLDNLDADDIERLRQRRMDQLKQQAAKKQARRSHDATALPLSLLCDTEVNSRQPSVELRMQGP